MLWIRGLIFTLLVPGVIGGVVPSMLDTGMIDTGMIDSANSRHAWSMAGWLPLFAGIAIYTICLLRFLIAGGTPAIFFTRDLRFLIGAEPAKLVRGGIYRVSRNPMYIGVVLAVLGQAILFASLRIAIYAVGLCLLFHLVVVFLEEPHLRRERGPAYDEYCRQVPRWF